MSEPKKVKLRMGMHNRVTIDRWQAIKDDLNAGIPVAKAAKRHSVSEGTVRKVRRSKNFHEYRIRAEELKKARHEIVVIAPKSGIPFEDFGPKPFFSSKTLKPRNPVISNRLDRESDNAAKSVGLIFLLATVGLSIIGIVGLVVIMVCGSR